MFFLPLQCTSYAPSRPHQPPIGAHLIYEASEDYIVFVVGGPNRRSDYHINMTEEFFYQIKGDMVLKVVINGEFKDIEIAEGSIFLLPACVPHSPQRGADTVGLVIERRRTEDLIDRLRWYCEHCREILYEELIEMKTLDIGGALAVVVKKFYASAELRTCKHCKKINAVPENRK